MQFSDRSIVAWWAATSILLGILVGAFLAVGLGLGFLWFVAVPLGLGILVIASRMKLLALSAAFLTLGAVWLLWVRPIFVATCEFEPCDYSTLLALALLATSVGVIFGALFLWQLRRAVRKSG